MANWQEEDLVHDRKKNTKNDSELFGESLRHQASQVVDRSAHERTISFYILSHLFASSRMCTKLNVNIILMIICYLILWIVKSAGSSLILEVISGPSCGLQCSRQSTNSSVLPLTLGRISSSDLFLEDAGVSGKHAAINWNKNVLCLTCCAYLFLEQSFLCRSLCD